MGVTPSNLGKLADVNLIGLNTNLTSTRSTKNDVANTLIGFGTGVASLFLLGAASKNSATNSSSSQIQAQVQQQTNFMNLYNAVQSQRSVLDGKKNEIDAQLKQLQQFESDDSIKNAIEAEQNNIDKLNKQGTQIPAGEGKTLSLDDVQTKLNQISTQESNIDTYNNDIKTLTTESNRLKTDAKTPTSFSISGFNGTFAQRTIDDKGDAQGTSFNDQLQKYIKDIEGQINALGDNDEANDRTGVKAGVTGKKDGGKSYNKETLQSILNLLNTKSGDAIAADQEVDKKAQMFKDGLAKEEQIKTKQAAITAAQQEIDKLKQEVGYNTQTKTGPDGKQVTTATNQKTQALIDAESLLEQRSTAINNKTNLESLRSEFSTTTTTKTKGQDGKEVEKSETKLDPQKVKAKKDKLLAAKAAIDKLLASADSINMNDISISAQNKNLNDADKADGNWFTRLFSRSKRVARNVTKAFKQDLANTQNTKQANLQTLYNDFLNMNKALQNAGLVV